MKKLKIILPVLLVLLFFTACKAGAERYELTRYVGKSVSTFERRSGINLEKQSNGVYVKEEVAQVIAPVKKVTSVTLLKKAGKYKIFDVGIGMTKKDAEGLLAEVFGKENNKTVNSEKNTVAYSYQKDGKQLYVSYDKDKETVVELSYYIVSPADQKEAEADTGVQAGSGKLMLVIGDAKVYYNEAMVYLKSAQDNYEADYGKNIWKADILGNGETFGKLIKEEVIKQITELKIIRSEAEKEKITLEEEEQAEAAAYAKEHFEGLNEEDKRRYLITEELLKKVYEDNLLANKVFENLTINVDTEVPSETVKQITVQDIYIQNFNLDSEGKKVALSEEDKEEAYDKVKSLLEQAKKTEDFKSLAESNSEAETIEFTFGKGEGPKEYGKSFEEQAFSLTTGEVSDIITTDTGWHILYCVTDFNKDATIQVKERIIEKRRNDLFSKLYKEWSADYAIVVDQEAWKDISLED